MKIKHHIGCYEESYPHSILTQYSNWVWNFFWFIDKYVHSKMEVFLILKLKRNHTQVYWVYFHSFGGNYMYQRNTWLKNNFTSQPTTNQSTKKNRFSIDLYIDL